MSQRPFTPVFSKTPTPAYLGPSTLVPEAGNIPSLLDLVPATPAPFRPLFNDFGLPFMGYVWAMKPFASESHQNPRRPAVGHSANRSGLSALAARLPWSQTTGVIFDLEKTEQKDQKLHSVIR